MTLEVRGLSKRLGHRRVLEGVDLRCGPSELVIVRGENGSGKTTLLRLLAGIIEPDEGSIHIAGRSLSTEPVLAKAQLGYVPDNLDVVPELAVSELLGLVAALKSQALRAPAEIEPRWRARLGVDGIWGQRLRSLSFGQRKRVALLAALIGEPRLLILDEPTNGLDPAAVDLLVELLDERCRAARTTLLTSHDRELSERVTATRYRMVSAQLTRC
jgi:ABC-type multidrug transport system ATPase subunit